MTRMPRILLVMGMAGALAGCRGRDSIELRLENVGSAPLESLVIYRTGRPYRVGNLSPGTSMRMMVGADGESHIEVEHGRVERRRSRVGTYFESGYGGSITMRLAPDSVVAVLDSIRI